MDHETVLEIVKNLDPEDFFFWDERAAIMEYEGGLSREDAEIEAYKCLLKYKKNQRTCTDRKQS